MESISVMSTNQLVVEISRQMKLQGWAILGMEYEQVPFFLTVGMEFSFSHPNLEVFGLEKSMALQYFQHIIDRVRKGETFQAGDFISGTIPGRELILVENPADPNSDPITGGRLRLVWPDANFRYPWDHDCDQKCAVQTYLPPVEGLNLEGIHLLIDVLGAED